MGNPVYQKTFPVAIILLKSLCCFQQITIQYRATFKVFVNHYLTENSYLVVHYNTRSVTKTLKRSQCVVATFSGRTAVIHQTYAFVNILNEIVRK